MSLQAEIDKNASEIYTDGYPMSIGELVNLYEGKEIDIHPEFQRFFRWTLNQKSRLIESILLGIPIPSIFVVQRSDGVWDVIDGLQRLSTIFEFIGILKGQEDTVLPAIQLEKTRYLPSLEGKFWEIKDNKSSLTTPQRLLIKRAKLDVKILKAQSSKNVKYDLFQRLNSGGTPLSDQELRNGMLVGLNKEMFDKIEALSRYPAFQETISLSENPITERYDMELVLRFMFFRNINDSGLINLGDLGSYLTDKMLEVAEKNSVNYEEEERIFKFTFDLLNSSLGDDSFRKYDHKKEAIFRRFYCIWI